MTALFTTPGLSILSLYQKQYSTSRYLVDVATAATQGPAPSNVAPAPNKTTLNIQVHGQLNPFSALDLQIATYYLKHAF
jgi:hypothetical protein